jgi:hypothetical protein
VWLARALSAEGSEGCRTGILREERVFDWLVFSPIIVAVIRVVESCFFAPIRVDASFDRTKSGTSRVASCSFFPTLLTSSSQFLYECFALAFYLVFTSLPILRVICLGFIDFTFVKSGKKRSKKKVY